MGSLNSSVDAANFDINSWLERQISVKEAIRFPEHKSKYTIVPSLKTPSVDPGDTVEIDLFIAGYGIPYRNKLTILHRYEGILDEDDPGEISTHIAGNVNYGKNLLNALVTGQYHKEELGSHSTDLDLTGTTLWIADSYFVDRPDSESGMQGKERDPYIPMVLSEYSGDNLAPLEIKFNTAEDADPGDYETTFVFTYIDGQITKQSSRTLTVHINNRTEQLEPWWTRLRISAGAAAVLALIIQANLLNSILDIVDTQNIINFISRIFGI